MAQSLSTAGFYLHTSFELCILEWGNLTWNTWNTETQTPETSLLIKSWLSTVCVYECVNKKGTWNYVIWVTLSSCGWVISCMSVFTLMSPSWAHINCPSVKYMVWDNECLCVCVYLGNVSCIRNVCAWGRRVYVCFSVLWCTLINCWWQILWWANIRSDRFSVFDLSISVSVCLFCSLLNHFCLLPHLLLLSFSLLTPFHISSPSSSSPLVLLLCSSSLPFLLLLPVVVLRAEELLLVFSFPEPLLDIEPSSSLGNRL